MNSSGKCAQVMESRFAQQQYLVGQERRNFAHAIGLDEFQVIRKSSLLYHDRRQGR
jgi:hypothetical protein